MIKKYIFGIFLLGGIVVYPSTLFAQSTEMLNPATQNPQAIIPSTLQPTGSSVQRGTETSALAPVGPPQQDLLLDSTKTLHVEGTNPALVDVQGVSNQLNNPGNTNNSSYWVLWMGIAVLGTGFITFVYWQLNRPHKSYN